MKQLIFASLVAFSLFSCQSANNSTENPQDAQETSATKYREVAAQAEHPWSSVETETALLDLFLLHKAAYEVGYEAANRPGWLGLPVRGLARLADRLTAGATGGT